MTDTGTDQETVASLNRLIDAVMSSLKGTTGKPWVGTLHQLADQLAKDGWTRNNPMLGLESKAITPELEDDDYEDDTRPWAPYHPYHVAAGCTNTGRLDSLHTPGRGRDWKECIDCDEWPFEESRPTKDSSREDVNAFNRAYVQSLRSEVVDRELRLSVLRRSADLIERSTEQLEARDRTWRGDCV